jgi:hypothetical protein
VGVEVHGSNPTHYTPEHQVCASITTSPHPPRAKARTWGLHASTRVAECGYITPQQGFLGGPRKKNERDFFGAPPSIGGTPSAQKNGPFHQKCASHHEQAGNPRAGRNSKNSRWGSRNRFGEKWVFTLCFSACFTPLAKPIPRGLLPKFGPRVHRGTLHTYTRWLGQPRSATKCGPTKVSAHLVVFRQGISCTTP